MSDKIRGVYPYGKDFVGVTEQGGVKQYIVMARTGHVWFVSTYFAEGAWG